MNVYRDILREEWDDVSPKVKNSHLSGEALFADCCLDVVGVSGVLGKIIGRMAHLPQPVKSAKVTLRIRSSPHGEIWERSFPDCQLNSIQSQSPDGYLVDRFSLIAFCFRLRISNTGIVHHHIHTYLILGSRKLRLPRFLSPRIISHEEPDANENASRIQVSLYLPLVGHVLTYSGIVRPLREGI